MLVEGPVLPDGRGHERIFFIDGHHHALRLINRSFAPVGPVPAGSVGRVAGGYFGCKAGPALLSEMRRPRGIARDASGNIYVADNECYVIWRLSADYQTITQVIGARQLYGDTDGVGTAALLNAPSGLAYVAGYLFIADEGNNRIRRVDLSTMTVTTLAGTGIYGGNDGLGSQASFRSPRGLFADSTCTLYISEAGTGEKGAVRRIRGACTSSPQVETLVPARTLPGRLWGTSLSVDPLGQIYLAGNRAGLIRLTPPQQPGQPYTWVVVVPDSGILDGSWTPGPAPAQLPGFLYVGGDSDARLELPVSTTFDTLSIYDAGSVSRLALFGQPGVQGVNDGPAQSATFKLPGSFNCNALGTLATDSAGRTWVADPCANRVRRVESSGYVTSYGSGIAGEQAGDRLNARFCLPVAITASFMPDGKEHIFVADVGCGHRILRIDVASSSAQDRVEVVRQLQLPGQTELFFLDYHSGMTADLAGNLYVTGENSVVRIPSYGTGTPEIFAGTQDVAGCVAGTPGTGRFMRPIQVVINPDAPYLYVADNGCGLRYVSLQDRSIFKTLPDVATFSVTITPHGAPRQWLYADRWVSPAVQIVRIDPVTDQYVTIAGGRLIDNDSHYLDGPGDQALFWSNSLTVAPDGSLRFFDRRNNRIRRVIPPPSSY